MKNRPTTDYRAVFSDMDGTLLDREHRIPERNRAAIARLQARGIPFVLASGRPSFSMLAYHRDIGAADMVSMNGALIFDKDDRILRSVPLGSELFHHAQTLLPRDDPRFAINYYHHLDWFTDHPEHDSVQFERRITGRDPRTDRHNLRDAHKIMICGDGDDILSLQTELRHELPMLDVYRSHRCYLEVMHPDSGKGKAMAFLAERYDIPLDACIALGDNDNDISMLRRAGLAVVMDNAEDSIKAHADIIAAAHYDCGFADIIDTYFPPLP